MHVTEDRVVPVVVNTQAIRAESLGEAWVAGGIPAAAVTPRPDAAPEAVPTVAAFTRAA